MTPTAFGDLMAGGVLAYGVVLCYAAVARMWARLVQGEAKEILPPPAPPVDPTEMPAWPIFPTHPHSNLGWDREARTVTCAASDPDLLAERYPGEEVGRYLCRDCKGLAQRYYGEATLVATERADLAVEYADALRRWEAAARPAARRRSPWLWPLWLLAAPLRRLSPGGRP